MIQRLLWAGALGLSTVACAQDLPSVLVQSGDYDRDESIVCVQLEGPLPEDSLIATGPESTSPIQINEDGRACFRTAPQESNQVSEYKISAGTAPDSMSVMRDSGSLVLARNDTLMFKYVDDPVLPEGVDEVYRRGGFIHPVMTPGGIRVSGSFPEAHLHHHGIWGAWTKTVFQGRTPDFWNAADRSATVEPTGVTDTWSGPISAGFRSGHTYVDLTSGNPIEVLKETWSVEALNIGGGERKIFVFDVDVSQELVQDSALVLPEYHYGGLGFRGHETWDGEGKAFFLTSEGKDRSNGHATRARWCHIGGLVDGEMAGIAILGHPDNFEAPQPMRIHPTESFFNWAPSQAGDWSIQPGETYRARYRFVVYDGEPDAMQLDRLWAAYAKPATAELVTGLGR